MTKYNKSWDLTSIPIEAIPDELLKSWWAKRNGAKGGSKSGTPTDDPAVLAFRASEAKRIRELRARQKEQKKV